MRQVLWHKSSALFFGTVAVGSRRSGGGGRRAVLGRAISNGTSNNDVRYYVKSEYEEREDLKRAGGTWDKESNAWCVP